MSSRRRAPLSLLIATVLLGGFAIGGGLWARYRPHVALRLPYDRGDIDGSMLRVTCGDLPSCGVVLMTNALWLAKQAPSPGPPGEPAGTLLHLARGSGSRGGAAVPANETSTINLLGPLGTMRVTDGFSGLGVGPDDGPSVVLADGWGDAVTVSPGGLMRNANVGPTRLDLGAFGVHLGRTLWIANRGGGVQIMGEGVALWTTSDEQETEVIVSWPKDLFTSYPATTPP